MTTHANVIALARRAQARPASRWLALGAIVGPVLFTLAWSVLGLLSPGLVFAGSPLIPASPVTAPISGLGLGPTGPFMNAAFVLGGTLLIFGVLGVFSRSDMASGQPAARWACAALLALSGFGMVVAGIFTLESHVMHFVGFGTAAGAPVLSFLAAGFYFRAIPRWRQFGNGLLLASPLTLVLFVLSQLTFDQATIEAGQGVAGVTSRFLALEVCAWFAALGWFALRTAD